MCLIIRSDSDSFEQVKLYKSRLNTTKHVIPNPCRHRVTSYGNIPRVRKFSDVFKRIPRSKWSELIIAGEGSWLSSIRANLLEPHDQGSTPLCWAHGCVRAVEVMRLYQGQKPLLLSGECVAYFATDGRMRGGSPDEALAILMSDGTCDQNLWPKNSFNVKYVNRSAYDDRKNHIVLDWLDIENFDDQMSCALMRLPVAIGLSWWGHLVCQLDPILFSDDTFGVGVDNSWGKDWGNNGYGIIHESKATADLGGFALLSESFSES
jgi:hypothetical protein